MARKQVTGYVVRRPMTLWGTKREIGDKLTPEEVRSLGRIESMVRSGRISEVYTDVGEQVVRTRSGKRDHLAAVPGPEQQKPRRKRAAAPKGD